MDAIDMQLERSLRVSEPAIGDDGFSDAVMSSLPRKRLSNTTARRWTLGTAAAVGSVVTSVLGAPLESAFSAFVLGGGYEMAFLAVAFTVIVLAVPVAWVFYSR